MAQDRDDDARQRLSGSSEPAAVLAIRYGVSEETARKGKRRDSVQDLSATPHNLQTTLTAAQEAVVVELRGSVAQMA